MADLPADQVMWLAFLDEIERVRVVQKGTGGRVLKNKVRQPYVVEDGAGERFVVGLDDLCDSRLCADRKRAELLAEYGLEDDEEEELEDDDDEEEGEFEDE